MNIYKKRYNGAGFEIDRYTNDLYDSPEQHDLHEENIFMAIIPFEDTADSILAELNMLAEQASITERM